MSEPDRHQWTLSNAYRAEQLLVLLYDLDTIRTEFGRRLLDARKILTPQIFVWYEKMYRTMVSDRAPITIHAQRSLLQPTFRTPPHT